MNKLRQATNRIKLSALPACARRGGRAARRYARQSAGHLLRFLRFSLAQMRGGGKLIQQDGVYYVPLWLSVALALLPGFESLLGRYRRRGLPRRQGGNSLDAPYRRQSSWRTSSRPRCSTGPAKSAPGPPSTTWNPRLLATVMQIESCGHPTVISNAGAQGLFQVMPFHFAEGEDMLNPDTNARRGSAFLKQCQGAAGGAIGLTLACYNGGASVINKPRENWSRETQSYYRWGVGIYSDALAGQETSETLDKWLAAGGARLCASAEHALGFLNSIRVPLLRSVEAAHHRKHLALDLTIGRVHIDRLVIAIGGLQPDAARFAIKSA